MAKKHPGHIRWFDELNADDVSLVGGKNASLGEMPRGVPVPNGFATTADAYRKQKQQTAKHGDQNALAKVICLSWMSSVRPWNAFRRDGYLSRTPCFSTVFPMIQKRLPV